MMSPSMVHHGAAVSILENRQLVLDAAYRDHPERFVRRPQSPPQVPKEVGSTNHQTPKKKLTK